MQILGCAGQSTGAEPLCQCVDLVDGGVTASDERGCFLRATVEKGPALVTKPLQALSQLLGLALALAAHTPGRFVQEVLGLTLRLIGKLSRLLGCRRRELAGLLTPNR